MKQIIPLVLSKTIFCCWKYQTEYDYPSRAATESICGRALEPLPEPILQRKYNIKAHQVRHVAHSLGQLGSLTFADYSVRWVDVTVDVHPTLPSRRNWRHGCQFSFGCHGSFVAIESVFTPKQVVIFWCCCRGGKHNKKHQQQWKAPCGTDCSLAGSLPRLPLKLLLKCSS